jgi:hypothetical protein
MPNETQQAVNWAITQVMSVGDAIIKTIDDPLILVIKVREYFSDNNISYSSYSYDDLKPYLI